MIREDHLHSIEKGVFQEQGLALHLNLMFQAQKKCYQYKPEIICLRDRTQTI